VAGSGADRWQTIKQVSLLRSNLLNLKLAVMKTKTQGTAISGMSFYLYLLISCLS